MLRYVTKRVTERHQLGSAKFAEMDSVGPARPVANMSCEWQADVVETQSCSSILADSISGAATSQHRFRHACVRLDLVGHHGIDAHGIAYDAGR